MNGHSYVLKCGGKFDLIGQNSGVGHIDSIIWWGGGDFIVIEIDVDNHIIYYKEIT